MNYFLSALRNYATFSGRARRSEYWFFALFQFLCLLVAIVIDNIAGTTIEPLFYGAFYFIVALGLFIPGLAVTVRRLHDVGKSGWFYLIILLPIVGAIWLLVLMFIEGKPGENEYGINPKEVTEELA